MKTIAQLIFSICIAIGATAQTSEWLLQESGTTNHLKDVYFVSEDIGFVVGEAGTVLKTINGGEEWINLNTGLSITINTLWFFNEQEGFIAGDEGNSIYKTQDGGSTWEKIEHSLSTDLWEQIHVLYFLDEKAGFAGAVEGMMKTVDGGESWESYNDTIEIIRAINFLDNKVGYAMCTDGILKTEDTGINWTLLKTAGDVDFDNGALIRSIEAMTEDTVYFGAPYYSTFYSSFDGGESLNYQLRLIQDLDFVRSHIGFALSTSDDFSTTIIKTTDAGETWTEQFKSEDFSSDNLKAIWMHDESKGWAVGQEGAIRHLNESSTTSLNQLELEDLYVFPNPASNFLNIKAEFPQSSNLHILDVTGRVVASIPNAQKIINVADLSNGLYFLQIENEGKRSVVSFIKE